MSKDAHEHTPDAHLDATLRPTQWNDYIGQERVKENLRILLTAAKQRGHAPEHMLFYGPPGLGKTTLAHLIAHELGTGIKVTSGPAIERVGDLASLLTNLSPHDILFIDEVHRLSKSIEEVLYPALESGVLDIIIGKGPSARTVQLELPAFTLVAATTQYSGISSPLRSRFSGGTHRLEFYTPDHIARILTRSATILGIDAQQDALREIATRSRATPRTANYLLKRCRDFAQVHNRALDVACVHEALDLLQIDSIGLNRGDTEILNALIKKFNGGPVGLSTLAAAVSEEAHTIEEAHEPYLMQEGLLERTPRGRCATARAYTHLGLAAPVQAQSRMLQ